MPLSSQHDHVPRARLGQGPADGLRTVGLHVALGVHPLHARQDILDDILRPLGAWVVRGDHHQVSQLGGHRPHEGALAPVPVSAAAEHTDQPARSEVPGGGKDVLQGIRRVGIVDDDGVGRGDRHHLHPALHPPHRTQGGGRLVQRDVQAEPACQRRQGVVDGKAAGDGQMDPGDLPPGHRLELHVAGKEADVLSGQVRRVLVLRVGQGGAGDPFPVPPARLVVQVEHRTLRLAEPAGRPPWSRGSPDGPGSGW